MKIFTKIKAGNWYFLWFIASASLLLFIYSHFVFFASPYGDAEGYLSYGYANIKTLIFGGYQPTYPHFIYAIIHIFKDQILIYYSQFLLYTLVILILGFLFSKRIGRNICLILTIFQIINIREFFYIANILTEILNLFLFFLCFAMLLKAYDYIENTTPSLWSQIRRFITALLCVILMILLGFTRSSNLIFLFFLFLFFLILIKSWKLTAIVGVAVCVVGGYNLSLRDASNNIGMNLYHYIVQSCEISPINVCPEKTFFSQQIPILSEWYSKTGSIVDVYGQFSSMFDPRFSREMEVAYLRTLVYDPIDFFHGALINYQQQITDRQFAIYPEDPNLTMLKQNPLIAFLGSISTDISILSSILPIIFVPLGIRKILLRTTPNLERIIYSVLISWIIAELISSNLLASQLYSPDISRMRLHYETQSLMLSLLLISKKVSTLFSS